MTSDTRKLLSEISSGELFEDIATAVLRAAEADYNALAHVGINKAGRAVRSPVDGIRCAFDASGRRLFLVQHTITARAGLRRKWLNADDGDLAKCAAIVRAERRRGKLDAAIFIATAAAEPDEELIRDLTAAAAPMMTVDLWPASRIAAFLDNDAEGQWIRSRYWDREQTRISPSRLDTISEESLGHYLPLVPRETIVDRHFDEKLAAFAADGRGSGFVIGESGQGKSSSLRRLADSWRDDGSPALVVPHAIIEQSMSVEQAIAATLQSWAPALAPTCGHEALALAGPDRPLLLIVEDINLAHNPRFLIERMLGWSRVETSRGDAAAGSVKWRLLCPVWRSNIGLADKSIAEAVERCAFAIDRFERREAVAALGARSLEAGRLLSPVELDDLAEALNDDPLLIGLNQDWKKPSPDRAIQSYIDVGVADLADQRLLATELETAFLVFAERAVLERNFNPSWPQVRSWFKQDSDTVAALRALLDHGRIINLQRAGDTQKIGYRHDRLRDHLLVAAMERLIAAEELPEALWEDPFYAGYIGAALPRLTGRHAERAAACNPASLFAALQQDRLDESKRTVIFALARAWTQSAAFGEARCEQQRFHALRYLARIDDPRVLDVARHFPASFLRREALMRNGDVQSGAALCETVYPGLNYPTRDRLIEHVLARHPDFVGDLSRLLAAEDLPPRLLEGALNLAGEVGDAALCDVIAGRWRRSPRRPKLTSGWIWASIVCGSKIDHPIADEVCDAWANLPDKVKSADGKRDRNPRWDVAGHSLQWGFARKADDKLVEFIAAKMNSDERLAHILSHLISHIDVPEAIGHVVERGAKLSRRAARRNGISFFSSDILRTWDPEQHGRRMSEASRQRAREIWSSPRSGKYRRQIAFRIWAQTASARDIADLASLEDDKVLAELALRARLKSGDASAVPLLSDRIWNSERGHYWWWDTRNLPPASLHDDIRRYMATRRTDPEPIEKSEADYMVSKRLMDARDAFAIEMLVDNWDHLRLVPSYVQAALYIATPETIAMAHRQIEIADDPARYLKHMASHWGIKEYGRPGVMTFEQLVGIERYLPWMDQVELYHYFDAANALGALEWRRKHVDPLLTEGDRWGCPGIEDAVFASLDARIACETDRSGKLPIDHWFKQREEELWDRGTLIAMVGRWAADRGSRRASEIILEVLTFFGERPHLDLIADIPTARRKTLAAPIENCEYAVRWRSI